MEVSISFLLTTRESSYNGSALLAVVVVNGPQHHIASLYSAMKKTLSTFVGQALANVWPLYGAAFAMAIGLSVLWTAMPFIVRNIGGTEEHVGYIWAANMLGYLLCLVFAASMLGHLALVSISALIAASICPGTSVSAPLP